METIEKITIEQQIIDLLKPILESEEINSAARQVGAYRSLEAKLIRKHNGIFVEFYCFPGGDLSEGFTGNSIAEVFSKIAARNPEAIKAHKIARLREELAALESKTETKEIL
jgi:hypothetical protein